ncbi:MAG: hypothetical protein ACHQ15_09065, partial [Candidatus Limnocylindrales bacterium]
TMAVDAVEIPAGAGRWVVFEGRFASCADARRWGQGSAEIRESVTLVVAFMGFERQIDLGLPFSQSVGAPPTGVCP